MHTLLRYLLLASATGALFAMPQSIDAQDTGQVTKPLSEPNLSTDRLPAPKPSARQGTDGKITVTWAPIEGAVRYLMWRSVPPMATAAVTLQNTQSTAYVDANVKAGSTYYYVVAAVNAAGIEGLRGGTTPVTATISAAPTTTTTTAALTVTATLMQPDPPRVTVSFSGYAGAFSGSAVAGSYDIQRTVYASPSADPALIDYARPSMATSFSTSSTSISDSLPSAPYARAVTYSVRANSSFTIGTAGKGDVIIPAAPVNTTTGGTTSTTGTTSNSASCADGSTTLTVAALASLTTGATTSLGSAGGSSARWLSLNEAIATVDASGSVTARAGGTTQVLAVSSSSDGSVRVVAIPVTVKP